MQSALDSAGLNASDVEYVNAHGTSTIAGDIAETHAVKTVFAGHTDKLCVSSTKSMIGHLLGASGSVEAIVSVLTLRDQVISPTINLDNPDEGCDLDYVPNESREMEVNVVLSNSFGFGGTNGSLIFSRLK
jgi:3-oxoacyl-[acyl-carrier-protein] synthase II